MAKGRDRAKAGLALVFIFTLAVMTVGCAGLPFTQAYTFHGTRFESPSPATDFALTNQDGRQVRLSDYRGKRVLLFFGYTHCPDVCPTTLATWKQVLNLLKTDAEQVRFVFVSVDPERDSPERLKEYLSLFSPTFIGLTGSPEEIEDVARAYGAYFKKEEIGSAAGYLVTHTALTYVIDPTGRLTLAFRYGTAPEDIAADLKYWLRGK